MPRKRLIPSMIASITPVPLFPTPMEESPKRSIFLSPHTSWFARLMIPDEKLIPESSTLSSSTESANAWKVLTVSSPVFVRFSSRSSISAAALSEKVSARIFSGFIPFSNRCRIFSVMTLVLPEPGPARTSWIPPVVTARCWEGERGMDSPIVCIKKL